MSKLLEFEKEYMCKKCKHTFNVQADFEQHYSLPKPTSCPAPEPCNSIKFACLEGVNKNPLSYKDYQEIKIQEQVCCSFNRPFRQVAMVIEIFQNFEV